ncbi:MAG: hypothetical protein ISQ08_10060 [Planctomycetes bacterium]|nr:hypothetical protein [Planctomycetota bacterium]
MPSTLQTSAAPRLLGQGLAARVYLETGPQGKVARKVFDSSPLVRLVQYAFLGAANPYAWSEAAVRGAYLRRRILAQLVPLWTGGRMSVAEALGHGWDADEQTYTLDTRWSPGRPPRLHHPLSRAGAREVRELREDLLPLLHEHLAETGFDGMLWQAGLGNPVSFANFLLEHDELGRRHWVWIDLESGVPALFPLDPRVLLRTYLPLSHRHGAPLFDHTDTAKLRARIEARAQALSEGLGDEGLARLRSDAAALEVCDAGFWSLSRLERSIASQVAKGKVSKEEGERWSRRPLGWWAREAGRGLRGGIRRAADAAQELWSRARRLPWRGLPRRIREFAISQATREEVARKVLHLRLSQWSSRGALCPTAAATLHAAVDRQSSSAWLSDFAVHVAIKPLVKGIEWLAFPALLMAGVVDEATVGVAILAGGSVSRTLYTAGRVLHDLLRGRRAPWVALGVGTLPVIGNLAFPAQIAWRSREEADLAAQFLLYDGMSMVGRRVPIWGGRDTLLESLANQAVDRFVPPAQVTRSAR